MLTIAACVAIAAGPAPDAQLEPASASGTPTTTTAAPADLVVERDRNVGMVSPETSRVPEGATPTQTAPVMSPPSDRNPGRSDPVDDDAPNDDADHPWSAGGIVDAAYIFNGNFPNNHVYRGAFTTPRTNEFTINVAGLFLEHRPAPSGGWSMQVGLHAGAAVDGVYGAEPQPGGVDAQYSGPEVFKHIALANAGVRLRKGTEIGLGVFSSPVGIGGLWSNGNWLYSSSWQSNWVPYYLSGLRVSQELPRDFRLEAWVVSGFQTISDVNLAPSGMLALYWAPDEGKAKGAWVAGHVYAGPETDSYAPESWLVFGSGQAGYDSEAFGLAAVWDTGRGGMSSDPTEIGFYTGGALFTRFRVLGRENVRLDVNARPELWWDRDGLTYGRPGALLAGALGLGLHAYDALIVRLEYRYDQSTAALGSFYSRGRTNDAFELESRQHTVFLNVTGHYSYDFGRRKRRR